MNNIKEVKNNQILWAREDETVVIPTKKDEDGGYDIYANFEQGYIIIPPHTTVLIPTKLHCAFSNDYVMILKERGSNGTKGIAQRSGVIDSGFRGEIKVPLTNTNEFPIVICKDMECEPIEFARPIKNGLFIDYDTSIMKKHIKYPYTKAICQAIIIPLPKLESREISLEELKQIPSERGEGMLGSSGK